MAGGIAVNAPEKPIPKAFWTSAGGGQ
jgi:hypothetical protein